MNIEIKDKGFFFRLLFSSGAIYVLIIFSLFETMVMWGEEFDWMPFLKINLIIFPLISLVFVQAFQTNKRYIYQLIIENNSIELYFNQLNSKGHISIPINDLYLVVKEYKFNIGKVKIHRLDFMNKTKIKKHGFELIFRQIETGDWNFELMKKIDFAIMRIQLNLQTTKI